VSSTVVTPIQSICFSGKAGNRLRPLIVTFLSLFLGSLSVQAFTSLVAFGDSYTDTGNLPSSPPDYWNGRFSNGQIWAEYLSQSQGFTYNAANNYAVSGTEAEDLGAQIANFPGTANSAGVVFAIWSGNNDFGNHLSLGTNDSAWNTRVTNAVASLMAASDLVYQKGARNLVLFNQLDLTQAPYIRNHYSAAFRTYLLGKIQTFNTRLTNSIATLLNGHPGLKVYYVDAYADVNYLLTHASSYGFTVVTQDALDDPSLSDKSFTGPGANYVFWDSQHPTTKTHNLVASWVNTLLPPVQNPPIVTLASPTNAAQFSAPATISLSATVNSNGWAISQVAFFHEGVLIGQKTSPPYSLTWASVPAGNYSVTAQATYGAGQTISSVVAAIGVLDPGTGPVPSPWLEQDIGAVGVAGGGTYSTNGTFRVSGSGSDIWDTADAFHYVYQPLIGNSTIIARVTAVQNSDGYAKACVMFRESLAANARNVLEFMTPSLGAGFQFRTVTNGTTTYTQGTNGLPPYWIKLERFGNAFNGYTSPDGTNWTLNGAVTNAMASTLYCGLAVTAHNNTVLNASTFDRVQIIQPGPPGLALKRLTNGTVQLTITGVIGSTYRAEASTNLTAWTAIATNLAATASFQVMDNQANSFPRRFYRAVLLR
jgi:phospholipase/lecithinase/hemolysin